MEHVELYIAAGNGNNTATLESYMYLIKLNKY